ncbi:MAG: molecular chaperone TorD family protein [Desulfopila sp.]|jgi:TorA maturation chaperone TorD|nr:molecular chaperone TorD family protein [Desulfopila sp.]
MAAYDTYELTIIGDCYRLLAACFYEPDKPLFVEQKVCSNLAMLLEKISPEAAEAARDMSKNLLRQEQQQMLVDYAALFVGPFELPAPPYGSVYLEKNKTVMGDTTLQVLKMYQDAGLQVEEKEPPDHIAIELEFLSFLCAEEVRAHAQQDDERAGRLRQMRHMFFTTFLDVWVYRFCEAVRSGTGNTFYLALADCLAAFVASQQRHEALSV